MQIRIFTFSVNSLPDEQEEMNKFLRGHRVIEVKEEYDVTRGLWTFAVNYIEGAASQPGFERQEKVDYKEVLSPMAFELFAKFRERRKAIAQEEHVPAYAIFTDKELARMTEIENLTPQGILAIDGINHGRADKYAERLLNDI